MMMFLSSRMLHPNELNRLEKFNRIQNYLKLLKIAGVLSLVFGFGLILFNLYREKVPIGHLFMKIAWIESFLIYGIFTSMFCMGVAIYSPATEEQLYAEPTLHFEPRALKLIIKELKEVVTYLRTGQY
jgi:hypothetical protein